MPAKPTWLLKAPEILEEIRALDSLPYLDRAAFERLFRVRRRRAIQLMAHFGGFQVGKTFLADRRQVIAALEALERGEAFDRERRRKTRISETLDRARRELRARRVEIAAPRDVLERQFSDLPAGIQLVPGELRIEFEGAQDLLRQLLELSQAIMNDYSRFESLVTEK